MDQTPPNGREAAPWSRRHIIQHEARLSVLESKLDLKVEHLTDLMDRRAVQDEKERARWAEEIQRRLHELNGHNDETRKNLELTVSRDKFDGLVGGDIKSLNAFKDNMFGRLALISGAASLLGGGGVAALIAWLRTQ